MLCIRCLLISVLGSGDSVLMLLFPGCAHTCRFDLAIVVWLVDILCGWMVVDNISKIGESEELGRGFSLLVGNF